LTDFINSFDNWVKDGFFKGRAVFLFGHCNATEKMADYLLERDVNIKAILDNSTSKHGLMYRNIPVNKPMLVKNYDGYKSVVLIASRFYDEMASQLRQIGYSSEIVKVMEYDSFTEYSLTDETFDRMTKRVHRGLKTLEKVRGQYPLEHLVICPNTALGDVYWAMSFLPAYQKKNGIDDIVVIVAGDSCRQVVDMFGGYKIITLNSKEMDELVQAIINTREDNCIIAHHDRPYTDSIIKLLDKRFISFIDYYKYAVYGLSDDAVLAQSNKFLPFSNKEKIPKGKSVILSPHSKSVVQLPVEFWDDIVLKYSKNGLTCYTNVAGKEKEITGTIPLHIPVSQIKSAVEYAGTFIGIRNGLCDIINTADCHKTVVYPDCYYSSTPFKIADFFALPGWEVILHQSI